MEKQKENGISFGNNKLDNIGRWRNRHTKL